MQVVGTGTDANLTAGCWYVIFIQTGTFFGAGTDASTITLTLSTADGHSVER